jgi:hypothetical protein
MFKPEILQKVEENNFLVFSDGDYDLNIVAVRNLENNPNVFDDKLHVCYLLGGEWKEHIFQVTTDPGRFYLEDESYRDGKGVAVIYHPQQARGAYKIGLHGGKYEALRQWQPVKFWRDRNFDDKADYTGEVHKDLIYVNIHRASIKGSTQIGRYSAGCIVFSDPKEFDIFMGLAKKQISSLGYRTYTLTILGE